MKKKVQHHLADDPETVKKTMSELEKEKAEAQKKVDALRKEEKVSYSVRKDVKKIPPFACQFIENNSWESSFYIGLCLY